MFKCRKGRYNIEDRRLALGMSRKEFGELCGLSESTIARIENGKTCPRKATREGIMNMIVRNASISEQDLFKISVRFDIVSKWHHILYEEGTTPAKRLESLVKANNAKQHDILHIRKRF